MSCPFCERELCDRDCGFCDQFRHETGAPYRRTAKEWRELGAKQFCEQLLGATVPTACTCGVNVTMHKDGCPELLSDNDLLQMAVYYYSSPIWVVGIQRIINELIVRRGLSDKLSQLARGEKHDET